MRTPTVIGFVLLLITTIPHPLLSAEVGQGTNNVVGQGTNNVVGQGTNHVLTTNWMPAPPNYRMLAGKLQNSQDLTWQNVSFEPTHYWDPARQRFSQNGSPYTRSNFAQLHEQSNRPPGLPENTKLFTVSSISLRSGFRFSITVSNVPLSSQDLFDGGAAGLARTLNVRAYPLKNVTNTSGFKVESITRVYDYGLPYFGKVPIVSKRPIAATNDASAGRGNPKPGGAGLTQ